MLEFLDTFAPLYPVVAAAVTLAVILLELGMFKMVLDTRRIVIRMDTKQGLCEVCPQRSAPVSVSANPPAYTPWWLTPFTSKSTIPEVNINA